MPPTPQSPPFSQSRNNAHLSHAISLFIHKDRTSFFDDDSIASGAIASFEDQSGLAESSTFDWDLRATLTSQHPAFRYVSDKLHQRGLSVALIVSDRGPHIIPVWPLPRKSQILFAQILRRAVKKFSLRSSWLTVLASMTNKSLPALFDTHRPDSYIVRRSIVQHEVVFSEEGLTLLCIDHIFTFKQLLRALSQKRWVPHEREACLSSCVHLLHHLSMNDAYTDLKVSGAYLTQVYEDIEYDEEAYNEVISAYEVNYCTASIKDFTTIQPDYIALADINSEYEGECLDKVKHQYSVELPSDTSTKGFPIELATMDALDTPYYEEKFDIVRPLRVKCPTIRPPSSIPESPLDPDAPWSSAIPAPLKTRRASTIPSISQPFSYDTANWPSDDPMALDIMEAWTPDVQAMMEPKYPGESRAPFEYADPLVEDWKMVRPGVLCKNCHEVAVHPLVARRFTMA